jgi:hypothetical protein
MAGGGRRWPSATGIITAGMMVLPVDRQRASREPIRRVNTSVGIRRAGLDEVEFGGRGWTKPKAAGAKRWLNLVVAARGLPNRARGSEAPRSFR